MNIATLKPYVDRAASEYGIVLFDFGIAPPDHKLHKIAPTFSDHPNAVALPDHRVLYLSKPMLALPRNLILAAISHELAHLVLGHRGSDHKAEYEADMTSLDILELWQIPARSLIDLFKYIVANETEGKVLEDCSSHPGTINRVEYLEKLISSRRVVK